MRIKIKFGFNGSEKDVYWNGSLDTVPHLFRHDGKKWEAATYQSINEYDYEFTYSELPNYDPNFYVEMKTFEEAFGLYSVNDCECGAIHSRSFTWDHMRMCKLWKPW